MDLYQLSVVVSYCLLSEGLFKGIAFFIFTIGMKATTTIPQGSV